MRTPMRINCGTRLNVFRKPEMLIYQSESMRLNFGTRLNVIRNPEMPIYQSKITQKSLANQKSEKMVREHVNIKLRDTIERKTEHLPKTRPIRNNQEELRKIATNKKPPGRTPKKKKGREKEDETK